MYKALYNPGTKVVSVKDPRCAHTHPNSVMYFSHVKNSVDPHCFLPQCKVVLVKRGKTGKARLDYYTMLIPLIWPSDLSFQDRLINYVQNMGHNFSAIIIEPVNEGNFNLNEVQPIEFLGFVLSKVMFLSYVCREYSNYNFWPKSPNFVLNIFRDTLAKNESDDLSVYVATLTTPEKRREILKALRLLESLLQQAVTEYSKAYKFYYSCCIDKVFKPIALEIYKKLPDYFEELTQLTT